MRRPAQSTVSRTSMKSSSASTGTTLRMMRNLMRESMARRLPSHALPRPTALLARALREGREEEGRCRAVPRDCRTVCAPRRVPAMARCRHFGPQIQFIRLMMKWCFRGLPMIYLLEPSKV